MVDLKSLLRTVAFAKSPEHERFVQEFEGQTRGRYAIAYLVGIQVLGGPKLRAEIEAELGNPTFLPDQLYSALYVAIVCDRAVRAGLPVVRLGELCFPAFRRAHRELFEHTSVEDGFSLLERASRQDSGYYGDQQWPQPQLGAGRAVVFRPGRPTPCEAYVGILSGMLQSFGVEGSARETACLWQGAPFCTFEAVWRD
jgi:hypothetical protein